MLEGLRKPTALIVIVVTLLAYGCPVQAIVHAFGLDERTVAAWRDRAGALAQARAEAARRRRHRRLPERRQEHPHLGDLGGPSEDRRLPVHHAGAEPRRRAHGRRVRDGRRRHSRPDPRCE